MWRILYASSPYRWFPFRATVVCSLSALPSLKILQPYAILVVLLEHQRWHIYCMRTYALNCGQNTLYYFITYTVYHVTNDIFVCFFCYFSLLYPSGKGVVLTHRNLISSAAGSCHATKFYPSDVWVLHLVADTTNFKVTLICQFSILFFIYMFLFSVTCRIFLWHTYMNEQTKLSQCTTALLLVSTKGYVMHYMTQRDKMFKV